MVELKIIGTCILIMFVSVIVCGNSRYNQKLPPKEFFKKPSAIAAILLIVSCAMILGSLLSLIWS